jgi:hypothetical protein
MLADVEAEAGAGIDVVVGAGADVVGVDVVRNSFVLRFYITIRMLDSMLMRVPWS